jgi:hypothetical protein
MAGRLAHALGMDRLEEFAADFERLKKEGQIKPEYIVERPKSQATLLDLLQLIEQTPPERDLFDALKSIFFRGVSNDSSETDSVRSYEFFQVAKALDSGDILVLKACFRIHKSVANRSAWGAFDWGRKVAEEVNLPGALIELHEMHLNQRKLVADRRNADRSGLGNPETFGLTDLAVELCEFITAYSK